MCLFYQEQENTVLLLPGISHPLPGKEPGQSWPGSLYFITSLTFGHQPGAAQRCQKAAYNEFSEHGCLRTFSSCWLTAQLFVNFCRKMCSQGGSIPSWQAQEVRRAGLKLFQEQLDLGLSLCFIWALTSGALGLEALELADNGLYLWCPQEGGLLLPQHSPSLQRVGCPSWG